MTRQQAIARNYLLRLRAMREEMLRRLAAAYAAIAAAEAGRRETVAITPKMAAEWLANLAVDHRPIDQAEVARIAADIRAGKWQPDNPADPIQLAPGERLLNGRHRLSAIVAAGLTVQALVAFDVMRGAIQAGFDAFVPLATRTITAGQGGAQTLTRAYIRGTGGYQPEAAPSLAGKSEKGTPITEAIVAMLPFILMAIKDGQTPSEALTVGAEHVNRMADNEMTRVVDAEINRQVSGHRSVGWTGIVNAPCDMCAGNAGDHSWDEEMFRHANCRCDRLIRWEDFAYTAPELALA